MKTRNVIILALALIFNDFVGSIIASLGHLLMKIGSMVTSIPTLF